MTCCKSGHQGFRVRCCRRARGAVFIAIWFSASWCLGSEGALPNISGNDNRTPAGRLEAGVLTIHLEVREGLWHPEGEDSRAIKVYSFAEEGHPLQTPGPLVRVAQGTKIRAHIHNLLAVAVHVNGLHERPGKPDDELLLAPGETKEVTFTPGAPGSYFYSASTTRDSSEDGMMSAALVVEPSNRTSSDRIFVIQLWDHDLFNPKFDGVLSINGKSWPHTERLHAQLGQAEHWRVVNATPLDHPMHMHGFYFYVDAMGDGETEQIFAPADRPMVVTQVALPGHSFDMTWMPQRAGNWLFHCHILDHMMHGYRAAWLYGPDGPPATAHQHVMADDDSMGMGELVMGITVSDKGAHIVPAKLVTTPATAERHLYVRERPSRLYVPAGPGFYLEGVSKETEPIGPPLVITRGERTAITIHNELDEATAIHWHGLEIESYYDGVPLWDGTPGHTTPHIAPHSTFVAYMTPPRAGTFIYHTHWNDVRQLLGGMYGAIVVLESGQKYDPATDKVFVLGRNGTNEMRDPLVLNGSPQPSVMVLVTGQSYRFRIVNITPLDSILTASLMSDGKTSKWRPIAKDGADLPSSKATPQDASQLISVGETYDYEFSPIAPGNYQLQFVSDNGNVVTQVITVVPPQHPFSVFVAKQ
jgi:FtsP/CotA-like multicopper oxidase with cupredoxin domain